MSNEERQESARQRREEFEKEYLDRLEVMINEKSDKQVTRIAPKTHTDRLKNWIQITNFFVSLEKLYVIVQSSRNLKEQDKVK